MAAVTARADTHHRPVAGSRLPSKSPRSNLRRIVRSVARKMRAASWVVYSSPSTGVAYPYPEASGLSAALAGFHFIGDSSCGTTVDTTRRPVPVSPQAFSGRRALVRAAILAALSV
jgi:hypothetical protein